MFLERGNLLSAIAGRRRSQTAAVGSRGRMSVRRVTRSRDSAGRCQGGGERSALRVHAGASRFLGGAGHFLLQARGCEQATWVYQSFAGRAWRLEHVEA
jgi:hypothetical protein